MPCVDVKVSLKVNTQGSQLRMLRGFGWPREMGPQGDCVKDRLAKDSACGVTPTGRWNQMGLCQAQVPSQTCTRVSIAQTWWGGGLAMGHDLLWGWASPRGQSRPFVDVCRDGSTVAGNQVAPGIFREETRCAEPGGQGL